MPPAPPVATTCTTSSQLLHLSSRVHLTHAALHHDASSHLLHAFTHAACKLLVLRDAFCSHPTTPCACNFVALLLFFFLFLALMPLPITTVDSTSPPSCVLPHRFIIVALIPLVGDESLPKPNLDKNAISHLAHKIEKSHTRRRHHNFTWFGQPTPTYSTKHGCKKSI